MVEVCTEAGNREQSRARKMQWKRMIFWTRVKTRRATKQAESGRWMGMEDANNNNRPSHIVMWDGASVSRLSPGTRESVTAE